MAPALLPLIGGRAAATAPDTGFLVDDFGAAGDDAANDTDAINLAIAEANAALGDVAFSQRRAYRHGDLTPLARGVRFISDGPGMRWRPATIRSPRLRYTGSTAAIHIASAAGQACEGFELFGVVLDGQLAGPGASGLWLDGSANASAVEGVLLERSAIINFPVNQLKTTGTVFDVSSRYVSYMNPNRPSADLVSITGVAAEWTFDDCWLMPYTPGTWGLKGDVQGSLRFTNGSVAPQAGGAGANGVWAIGQVNINGTHFEGGLRNQPTSIGIRYQSSAGAFISPGMCASFGIGVQIGVPGSIIPAVGWFIAGTVGGNTIDVQIANGGNRHGTIAALGLTNGAPVINDLHGQIDGVYDIKNLI